ncbi:uncharacterized protein A4U43_C02F2530 [Asparagus officinalis]|uniref:Pentacotripeptide-repeat region of PRORP domain-containing protein n=1 Tax=Asparagus officinalis TaxID=4686 RepID=A0A5P1FF95_ASPOF|nr:uncharacterized protein A4U43_C02F2530 [Asparagus officinalis]
MWSNEKAGKSGLAEMKRTGVEPNAGGFLENGCLQSGVRRLIGELKAPENISRGTSGCPSSAKQRGGVEVGAWSFPTGGGERGSELKDISVFRSMLDLFSRSRRHKNVIEVFDEMRRAGFFPDSEMIAIILNAYGKLQEFDRAEALYREMKDDGCVFDDRVHFQMLSLLGARRDFEGLEALIEELKDDRNIDKKELRLVAANVYERANKLDEAARIVGEIGKRSSDVLALE